MSAIETEVGVGQCPDRPAGMGHVWAGTKPENGGDGTNPCVFCGTSGRVFFKKWCRARAASFDGVRVPMESGTGNPAKAWPKGMPPEMAERVAAIVEDKKRRDAEAVANGTARPGQMAGAPKGRAK